VLASLTLYCGPWRHPSGLKSHGHYPVTHRREHKLEPVEVGRYNYRHEAEFAAGFLEDGDIPYRLQIDDPLLGMTMGAPAILWVRRVDEARARELLGADPSSHLSSEETP
jgi:hypothetical protein